MKMLRQWTSLLAIAALSLLVTGTPISPPVPLVTAQSASIEIVAPSFTSGDDFATVEVGNPWDMDSTDDIDAYWTQDSSSYLPGDPTVNTTYSAENGILTIQTNEVAGGCNGIAVHRPLAFNMGGKRIDTSKYRYFSYYYQLSHAPQSEDRYKCGNVNRIRWYQNSPVWAEGRTDDILIPDQTPPFIAPNDWYTYTIDLWTYPVEKGAPFKGIAQWNVMQLMFHEANYGWPAQLDWAMLTANNTASDSYTVQWNVNGLSSSEAYTTTIYWATAPNSGGVLHSTAHVVTFPDPPTPLPHIVYLPVVLRSYTPGGMQPEADFSYPVGTDSLTSGEEYYIAIQFEDGVNPDVWAYSEVPVTIE